MNPSQRLLAYLHRHEAVTLERARNDLKMTTSLIGQIVERLVKKRKVTVSGNIIRRK